MNTCGTCKHKGEVLKGGVGLSPCNRIKHDYYSYGEGYERGAKAQAIDGSGYYATLCVEDDFGCILWEKK